MGGKPLTHLHQQAAGADGFGVANRPETSERTEAVWKASD